MSCRTMLFWLLILTFAAPVLAQPVVYSPGGATRALDMDPWQIDCIIDPAVRYVMAQATSQGTNYIDYLIVGINMEDSVCTELPNKLIVTGIPGAPPPGIEAYTPGGCWWEGSPIHFYDSELSGIVEASPMNPIPGTGEWRVFLVPLYPTSLQPSAVPNIEFYYIFESDATTRKILPSVNGLMGGTISSQPSALGTAQQDTFFYFEVPWDAEPVDSHKMHFPQFPDTFGMDIDFTFPLVLADDWTCTQSGPADRIRFWFSARGDWFNPYEMLPEIYNIHLSVHSNIPDYDYEGPLFSMPGDLLWEADFAADAPEVTITEYGMGLQGWYHPPTGEYVPDDHVQIYECAIENIDDPFLQEEGEVYWLDISIETSFEPLGWKTSDMTRYPADYRGRRYMDDAVWADYFTPEWTNITYPDGPHAGESLDLAFLVGTMPQVCCDGHWGPAEWCGQDCYVDVGCVDMTHDCHVNLMDYFLLTRDFSLTGPCLSGDFNGDYVVDLYDIVTFTTLYNTWASPCTPADEIILGGPAGKLHLSFSSDPNDLVTYMIAPAIGMHTLYVVARDLPSPLGATEFGILSNLDPVFLTGFVPAPPFNLDIGSGLADIVVGAPAEVSGPVVVGSVDFVYMGDERVSFELVPNANYGGLRWISPSSNIYHDWAMASPAFVYISHTAAVEPADLPAEFKLYASAPNPFERTTAIRYDLPADERVKLTVYDVTGKVVRTLVDLPRQAAGRHSASWDGRDAAGAQAAPGVYFYRLETERQSATQRMTLLR